MKFCSTHWTALREAVEDSGLSVLIAEGGEATVKNLASEFKDGRTIDNFDPLMGAHNAIWSMAMEIVKERYTQNPLMMMADDVEHPEWACPICALNWCHAEHDRLCTQEKCDWPKEYDWTDEMITGSVNHMLDEWKALRP